MSSMLDSYINKYNEVEGMDLNRLTETQLVGYYCKNFRLCMVDKLLDDVNKRVVPLVKGMNIKCLLEALSTGGT